MQGLTCQMVSYRSFLHAGKKDENSLAYRVWRDKGNIGRFHQQMPIPL